MPLSSLADPIDLARAHAAMDTAWRVIKQSDCLSLESEESERRRLAVIVVGLVSICSDEEELAARAVHAFRKQVGARDRSS